MSALKQILRDFRSFEEMIIYLKLLQNVALNYGFADPSPNYDTMIGKDAKSYNYNNLNDIT